MRCNWSVPVTGLLMFAFCGCGSDSSPTMRVAFGSMRVRKKSPSRGVCRCAVVHDVTSAKLTRQHNDANVMALGARLVGEAVALDCLKTFLSTEFEGGRHARRVAKLSGKVFS